MDIGVFTGLPDRGFCQGIMDFYVGFFKGSKKEVD